MKTFAERNPKNMIWLLDSFLKYYSIRQIIDPNTHFPSNQKISRVDDRKTEAIKSIKKCNKQLKNNALTRIKKDQKAPMTYSVAISPKFINFKIEGSQIPHILS